MTQVRQLLGMLLIVVLSGCSTMTVNSDYDPSESFKGLRTYDWIPGGRKPTGDPRIDDNTLLDTRVRNAVDRELAAKGFRRLTDGQPDFWVVYHVTLDKKTDITTLNSYYGYGPGWGYGYGYPYRPYGWGGPPETYVYQYEEGTLLLDIVEPETRKLIWRGHATDEVQFSDSPGKREEQVNEAVRRILALFPPK